MIDSLNNVYSRIKTIQDATKNMSVFKPERVKDFEKMLNANINSNNNMQTNKKNNTEEIHPLLKTSKIEKNELYNDNKNNISSITDAIKTASKKYSVSEDLIRAVIKTESNYDQYGVSKAGAMGLMQLMPKTMLELGVEKPFDIYQNIDGGVKYLKMLLDKYSGDLDKALSAYNAGPNIVDKVNGIPDIEETQNYVGKIKKLLN